MLIQVIFFSSRLFFLARAGKSARAAAPAGDPRVLPSRSLIDLMPLEVLLMSAKGALLYIMYTMTGASPGLTEAF